MTGAATDLSSLIERIEPPRDSFSECVSVSHNICGRRTVRKPCDCRRCQELHGKDLKGPSHEG